MLNPVDILVQFAILIGSSAIAWAIKTEIYRYLRIRKLYRPLDPGENIGGRIMELPDVQVTVDPNLSQEEIQRLWDAIRRRSLPRPYIGGIVENTVDDAERTYRHRVINESVRQILADYRAAGEIINAKATGLDLEMTKRHACAYYSGNGFLKCAINPASPCVDCTDYQENKCQN